MKLYILTVISYIGQEISQKVFFEKETAIMAFEKEKLSYDRFLLEKGYRSEREYGNDRGGTTEDIYNDDLQITIYFREFDFEVGVTEMTNKDILYSIKNNE